MTVDLNWCAAQLLLGVNRANRAAYMRGWNKNNAARINNQRRARNQGPARAGYLGYKKAHYLRHRQDVLAAQAKYRVDNPELVAGCDKRYRERNPELLRRKKREEYQRNKSRYRKTSAAWKAANPNWARDWYAKNKSSINAKRSISLAKRRKSDPWFRAAASMRSRVWALLKKISTTKSDAIGLEQSKLKEWLEGKFKPGMTWDNYGTAWHVDHVIPCAEFDLTKSAHLRRCFHYHNLQPLWAGDNIRKGAKLMRQTEFQLK